MGTESRRDGLVGRARAALAAAEVGADVTDAGVADLGALEVGTGDGVVTVDVTLPVTGVQTCALPI